MKDWWSQLIGWLWDSRPLPLRPQARCRYLAWAVEQHENWQISTVRLKKLSEHFEENAVWIRTPQPKRKQHIKAGASEDEFLRMQGVAMISPSLIKVQCPCSLNARVEVHQQIHLKHLNICRTLKTLSMWRIKSKEQGEGGKTSWKKDQCPNKSTPVKAKTNVVPVVHSGSLVGRSVDK